MLAISVLGPVEIRRDNQSLVVPAGKTTEVLIRLALDSRVAVSADRLIEDLWGVEATATERNTVQSRISKLRRALGDAAVVSGGRFGYALEVNPSAVDALEVLRVADAARELLNTGQLEALVVLHPLRERIWELLVAALYRAGRQAGRVGRSPRSHHPHATTGRRGARHIARSRAEPPSLSILGRFVRRMRVDRSNWSAMQSGCSVVAAPAGQSASLPKPIPRDKDNLSWRTQ